MSGNAFEAGLREGLRRAIPVPGISREEVERLCAVQDAIQRVAEKARLWRRASTDGSDTDWTDAQHELGLAVDALITLDQIGDQR
jgi:hypothetical protein